MSASEDFELRIVESKENKLIGRTELMVEIRHMGKGTPPRHIVRRKIAELLKKPLEVVYVRRLITEYGLGRTLGEVHVYKDPERAKQIEPEYIIIRNLDPEERKKILEARRGG